jgi:hypothetical protein
MCVKVTSDHQHQTVLDFATVVFTSCLTVLVSAQQADTDVFICKIAVEKSAQTNLLQRKYIYRY